MRALGIIALVVGGLVSCSGFMMETTVPSGAGGRVGAQHRPHEAVMAEVLEWQSRPLERLYPVVFFDALFTGTYRGRKFGCEVLPVLRRNDQAAGGRLPILRERFAGNACTFRRSCRPVRRTGP